MTELAMMNMNLFGMGIQLHDKSILQPTSKNDQIDDIVGSVLLGKIKYLVINWKGYKIFITDETFFPDEAPKQGFLIIALDPLQKINDVNRLDNIFIQYIQLQPDTSSPSEYATCDVHPELRREKSK